MDIERGFAGKVFSCIDNTTLAATDSQRSVEDFCRRTLEMAIGERGLRVAAVCVYPRFVGVAKRVLEGSGVKVAVVAGGFPHGQLPLEWKIAEVKQVVEQGADEVDVVISRGALLAGEERIVCDEVAAMKEACGGRLLKVILETGELPTPALVRRAAELAIEGGADFIKTSTGKISTGATLEAVKVMLECIQNNVKFNKKTVGLKVAGGIRRVEEAMEYATMAKKMMGDEYVGKQTFRVGASSLTEGMFSFLTL